MIKENNHTLFAPSMKLADILLTNYSLLSVLPRFGIQLGFGEQTVATVCKRYDIDPSFFLLICNVSSFTDYMPDSNEITSLKADSLIGYLKRSHDYYMEDKIAGIEQRLNQMQEYCCSHHHQILRSFFDEYKKEVIHHFRYEEECVFPYIQLLIQGQESTDYHINQYEQNHTNIEDKLSDLKNIIIKYLPESGSSKERNELLFEIFLFEEDLNTHSLIENRVLVPFVEKIEQQHA